MRWQLHDGVRATELTDEAEILEALRRHQLGSEVLVRREATIEWLPLRNHAPFAIAFDAGQPADARAAPQARPLATPPWKRPDVQIGVAVALVAIVGAFALSGHVSPAGAPVSSIAVAPLVAPIAIAKYDPKLPRDNDPRIETRAALLGREGGTVVVYPDPTALTDGMSLAQGNSAEEILRDFIGKRHAAAIKGPAKGRLIEMTDKWAHVVVTYEGVRSHGYAYPSDVAVEPDCEGDAALWDCPKPVNRPPLATFKSTSEEATTRFEVNAQISSYFNYEYANAQKTHYSVEIREKSLLDEVHAYIKRSDPTAKELFSVLRDGRPHTVTVELAFNKRARSTDVVRLVKFVCNGWHCDS